MFLVTDDYSTLIKQDRLNEIIDADNSILSKALPAAQEEAAGFIRHRYDEDETFKSVTVVTTDAVPAATTGDRFYQSTAKLFYMKL